ncbi:MAG: isoaspartyl peptidase/L-asparaginase, partial [Flavobacteriales bacterium]
MTDRRKFIKASAATGLGLGLGAFTRFFAQTQETPETPSVFKDGLVLSTWDAGIPANEAAWKAMLAGGNALDMAEKGVNDTEATLSNLTVGLGGFPDRDGHTTLDACIMDSAGNAGSVMFLEHIKHPASVARRIMEKTPHV